MKTWFFSLGGALGLSVLALLSQVWRGFLDAILVLPNDLGSESLMQLAALVFTLLFAGWAWALVATWQGSRRGLVAAFAINGLLLLAGPVSWLLVYCPADCRAQAGILNLANTLNLVLGVLAAGALGLQLRRNPHRAAAKRRASHV
jgi:hypothetical protein